jgi:hypothetical protein
MNLDSLIFDLEMASRRLPESPDHGGDNVEWASYRSLLPQLIDLAKEMKRGKEARKDA